MSPNFFASGGRSAAVFVRVFRHPPFVEFLLCSLVSFHPFWGEAVVAVGDEFLSIDGELVFVVVSQ